MKKNIWDKTGPPAANLVSLYGKDTEIVWSTQCGDGDTHNRSAIVDMDWPTMQHMAMYFLVKSALCALQPKINQFNIKQR